MYLELYELTQHHHPPILLSAHSPQEFVDSSFPLLPFLSLSVVVNQETRLHRGFLRLRLYIHHRLNHPRP